MGDLGAPHPYNLIKRYQSLAKVLHSITTIGQIQYLSYYGPSWWPWSATSIYLTNIKRGHAPPGPPMLYGSVHDPLPSFLSSTVTSAVTSLFLR
jgi:hypothetical protein